TSPGRRPRPDRASAPTPSRLVSTGAACPPCTAAAFSRRAFATGVNHPPYGRPRSPGGCAKHGTVTVPELFPEPSPGLAAGRTDECAFPGPPDPSSPEVTATTKGEHA